MPVKHQDYSVFSRESQQKPHLWLFLGGRLTQQKSYIYIHNIYIYITDVFVLHSPWKFFYEFTERPRLKTRCKDLAKECGCTYGAETWRVRVAGRNKRGKTWERKGDFLRWHIMPNQRTGCFQWCTASILLEGYILVCFWCCFTEVVGKIFWLNQKCREGSTLAVA